jgi:hypothetical protein
MNGIFEINYVFIFAKHLLLGFDCTLQVVVGPEVA